MNKIMKKILVSVAGLVVIILGIIFLSFVAVPREYVAIQKQEAVLPKAMIPQVEIAGKTIKVEIADTDAKRELGLSGHKVLSDDEGMIFIFDKMSKYAFWMKDMLYPLDLVWINSDMKVVYIKKNAQPDSYPEVFGGDDNAQYVLEVNTGFSDKNNLKIGDTVKISL